ncbi:Sec-independent protein translocase protein TatB [Azospira restricta]|uniref:Sec-independent protein translocase protein TatB n=1 Tax=Azospira restricta TaxID=404405 RepID=A0A974SNS1_9RHOO|nr:Sec-independent protein translocase protein TatB [Azospira restricta]QRJ63671.1 Sec-independent protein translocase subunit TatB [Azospira restricta]
MFDIGFSEMVVIAVVALVVLGPERLPKVARTAGHLLGRLQRYVSDVKADINREMQLEELKKLQAQVQDSARSLERSISTEMQSAEASLNEVANSVAETPKATVDDAVAGLSALAAQPVPGADAVATPPAAPAAEPAAKA